MKIRPFISTDNIIEFPVRLVFGLLVGGYIVLFTTYGAGQAGPRLPLLALLWLEGNPQVTCQSRKFLVYEESHFQPGYLAYDFRLKIGCRHR